MRLLIATRNSHKLAEIRQILSFPSLDIVGLDHLPGIPEVEEDGATFEANARKKAIVVAGAASEWTLADDSGLVVDSLGGAPGVHSARYAGTPADYLANNAKLIKALDGVINRRARFRCVLALASPRGDCRTVEGTCEGYIALTPRGDGGFGYDPLFIPDGSSETFAEMSSERKNAISHRARALANAVRQWGSFLSE